MPFAPTPAEVGLINAILNIADPQKLGLVTGEQGVKVFAGSKLPPAMLGDIWALADPENNGVLTRKGVAVTVRLIGWAQAGETPSEELIEKPGPLPVIEGVAAPAPVTSAPRQPAPIATLSTPLPPLAPADRAKFLNVYNKANPVNGLVSGDSAKNTFIRSKLPVDRLNAIWNLVDTANRGALDAAQFVLAMYFIQGSMSANPTIPVLPPSIPAFLWEQAGGRPPSVHTHTTGESLPSPKLSGPGSSLVGIGIPRAFSPQYTGGSGTSHQPGSTTASQFTGISAQPTGSRIPPSVPNRSGSNFPITPQLTGQPFPLARVPQQQSSAQLPWDITADEKAKSDGFFESLDTGRTGYIDGSAAGSFMLLSGLSEDILAKVWDLADMRNEGHFNRDTFAVAMHLINGVLEGKELPSSLPPTLVPPSMRLPASPFPNAFPAAQSAFALQQQYTGFGISQSHTAPAMSEAQRDLLSLDDTPAEPPKPMSPPPTTLSPQVTGAGLNAQFTSVSNHQATPVPSNFAPASRSFGRDLLDDEEAEGRQLKQLSDNNIGIANVRNQIASTQTAQANAERDRGDLETQVANSAATLSQLQTQLASAKVGYETETKLLEGLRERYTTQSKEIQSVRGELIRAESELSAVKLEKTEVGGSLLREKDDVRDLKKRLAEVLEETGNVKKEVEVLKKEVRLQRGLLVIAKKQLSTAETELEEAKKHVQESITERDEAIAEVKTAEDATARLKDELTRAASPKQNGTIPAAAAPLSGSGTPRSGTPRSGTPALPFADVSTVTSPAASFTPGARSGNPFDRLRGASVGSEASLPMRSASPFALPSGAEVTSPTSTHTQELRPGSAAGVASPVDDDDPFGFNEAPAITTTTSVEAPKLSEDALGKDTNLLDTTTSPTTEHLISPADTSFFTPPTSSGGHNILDGLVNEQRNIEQANENNLHDPATKFPDLTEDLTSIHNVENARAAAVTSNDFMENDSSNVDLDLPPLQEIVEKDESDSEDEDEKPLGKVKEEKQAASVRASTEAQSRTVAKSAEPASFDDAFGFDNSAATAPTTATTTAPSSHFSTLGSEKVLSSPASVIPGVNGHPPAASAMSAFDEAFGTLPAASEAKPAASTEPFKFDNFEDTFDFGNNSFTHARTASNEVAAAPAHITAPPPGTTPAAAFDDAFGPSNTFSPPSIPKPASSTAFDDAFGLPNTFSTPSVPKLASAPPSGPIPALAATSLAPLSFDDAFEVSTNDQPESKPKSVGSIPPGSPTSTQQTHDAPNGTSVRSPSPSAAARGSSSSGRPASPPQTTSPKLPAATPRPPKESAATRPGSKYDSSDGASSSRSRLSIHFPFGRSKSSKEKKEKEKEKKDKDKHAKDQGHANATGGVMPPVPPVPRQYNAINEQFEVPTVGGTPGEDGDLPVLKQLLEYGFDRDQAIQALENSGYNFQRALNKLL